MKKLLLIAAMAAIALSVPAWGQSINVTSPAAGVDWCIGTGYTITWTKSGVMPDTVKIRLRRAGAPESEDAVWDISDGTPNDGSFGTPAIPASVPAGDYYIRVRTNSPDVIGDSDTFQIVNCTASISVTSPNGTNWHNGSTYTIAWTRSGTMPDTVKIRLRRWGAPESEDAVVDISAGTANDGTSDSWIIPNSVPEDDYFVRVRTVGDPDVIGNSVKFHIKKFIVDPGIIERLKRRRYWEIKWPPEPDPCFCPEWRIPDFRDFREFLGKRFAGSIVLMKNGVKIQELGKFGGRLALPGSVKANLSREDFSLLKNGGAKFSIAILDGNGSILNESALEQAGQEQLLR